MSQIVRREDTEDWAKWEEICRYTRWNPDGPLRPMRYRGRIVPFCKELKFGPMFTNELLGKIHKILPIRMAVVGDAGSGKTYCAIDIALMLDLTFTVDQVVLFSKDFVHLQNTIKPKKVIILDEPTFSLAGRTWQNIWQRVVVSIIESSRFLNNPFLVPVVNLHLLDATVRQSYINYVVHVFERGIGRVYRVKQGQWYRDLKRRSAFQIYLYTPGVELARCGRITCLGCPELKTCNKYIWPQYERKREEAIRYYQVEAEKTLNEIEKEKKMSFGEVCKDAAERRREFLTLNKNDYLVADLMAAYDLGHSKAQDIKNWLLKYYPIKA